MPVLVPNEKELVQAALADLSAFSRLYELYADKIYNYCYYKIYNTQLAQDLTSEIFEKALLAFAEGKFTYQEEIGFGAWLYRIAHNKIVDHYKKASTKNENSLENLTTPPSSDEDMETLDYTLDVKIDSDKIKNIVADLDDQTQSIIVLKFTEDYSFKRIAEILETNESTVKMRYYRALEHIKNKLTKL